MKEYEEGVDFETHLTFNLFGLEKVFLDSQNSPQGQERSFNT